MRHLKMPKTQQYQNGSWMFCYQIVNEICDSNPTKIHQRTTESGKNGKQKRVGNSSG